MTGIRERFIEEAIWHGTLDGAERILAEHPELRSADIHIAAILGDEAAVRRFIAADPASVHLKSPPYGGDGLNYLGLSRYLRLDTSRTEAFERTAAALLDAGADPNTGFMLNGELETVGYGVAGVAHNARLTRLLIDRGADPNDVEVVYHSPETSELDHLKVIVETGRLTPESLALMLVRKHDWHHDDGVKYLLEAGADPNYTHAGGWNPLHHALARDNSIEIFELLMEHGANPLIEVNGMTGITRAAREGRSDVLDLFRRRGHPVQLTGVDRLIHACAVGDLGACRTIAREEPVLREELRQMGGNLLARFAGTCNTGGVVALLEMGIPPDAPFTEGDGYWDEPSGTLPIHIAAWRCCTPVLKVLIERGSPVDAPDPKGRTPFELCVKACTESYWTEYCSPEAMEALLDAGAKPGRVTPPTGHRDVDAVLAKRGHGSGR